ncbi:hypothetical protein GCM10009639_44550 [Kitasatospora putterlickiae]|uniref:CBM-cenC domain-containing protein n=1 Tax=Kitasatospora putterlickiae TaxID=221725 RepID=A0ABN1YBN3_9ACTN
MRSHRPRPRPRHAAGARPLGAAAGALVLAAAAALAANGSATAQPAPLDWIKNGDFSGPLARGWNCQGEFVQTDQGVEGRPSGQDYAGCSQTVTVVPGTRYSFSAYMSGPYTFATISDPGTGTGDVILWDNGPNWKSLATTVLIGDNVHQVTVAFHGWYGQDPYRISRVSMIGPMYPDNCPTPTPGTPAPTSTEPCLPRPTTPPSSPGVPLPTPTGG